MKLKPLLIAALWIAALIWPAHGVLGAPAATPPPGLGYASKAIGGSVTGRVWLAASGAAAAYYQAPEIVVRSLATGEITWSKATGNEGILALDLEGEDIAWVDAGKRLVSANVRGAGSTAINLDPTWEVLALEITPDWFVVSYKLPVGTALSGIDRRTGEARLIDTNLFQVAADGDWVIWYEINTAAFDVIAYNLATGQRRTIDTLSIGVTPSISNGRVAYALVETLDVAVYDLVSGQRVVYGLGGGVAAVQLRGDFLAWTRALEHGVQAGLLQRSTGARRDLIRPGDTYVWALTEAPNPTQVWFDSFGDERAPAHLYATTFAPVQPPAALDPEAPSGAPGNEFFDLTKHNIAPPFSTYWRRNGGLPQFGYPLSARFDEPNADTGKTYATQYLERQRFELHPENAGTAYEILLGRLGAEILASQGRDWRAEGHDRPGALQLEGACQTFEVTARTVCGPFLDYWRAHGLDLGQRGFSYDESLALFGLPLTAPRYELNADGDYVVTQWFERARFEYHPDNPDAFKVLLGRLGAELLAVRGWGD